MKNTLLLLVFFSILLTGCREKTTVISDVSESKNRITKKHEPSDEFFIQRSVDGRLSIEAYVNGLKQAKQNALTRAIDGFDQEWTTQGPGNIGARVNTVAVNPQNENIMYAGFSAGGVFKTTDGGNSWVPIFDDQALLSIGDIVLDPNDPEIVYVGTGDVNIPGLPFIGDGLYRSEDGGANWVNLGLEQTRIISKIAIDPTNSNKIFVGTMGLPFERNNDRGLYRSTDNGNSWDQVLFISDSTGVSDVIIDPDNPDIIYAVGWDRIRNNIESLISGQGARIFKSLDGGFNWSILEGGLPNEEHSRIGITMAGSNSQVLYAEYLDSTFQLDAIYKTSNGGVSWQPIPTDTTTNLNPNALGGFGWYFGKIRVNPQDEDDIFLLGVDLWRTTNGGQWWERAAPQWWWYEVHADKHDLVFTPSGSIVLATDGGLYKSDLSTDEWEDIENIPTTQFYRVAHNPHNSDFYYGGAQDNGSTGGNVDGINEWARIFGGDGFQMAFDPDDPLRFFAEYQRGNIMLTLDGGFDFNLATDGIDPADRRNWDMPYFISPHNRETLYTGTYRVYQGDGIFPFWFPISDDLTDGTEEAHRSHNITAINESPLLEGLLYVGTGDGNVWRKDEGSFDWVSISASLPDMYVTDVYPSSSEEDVVYVTYSGYRDNDFSPRIFRSEDRGNSWESISSNLPDLAINQLLVYPDFGDSILFVATDGGVYGTVDQGTEWERLGVNMPTITVLDLAFNDVKNELVAGTYARSIMSYPLDSITSMDTTTIVSTNNLNAEIKNSLDVYPNPANDYINIQLGNIEPGRDFEIVILNSSGQLLYHKKGSGDQGSYEIDISDWASGIYFVKAKMRHGILSKKFSKQ